VRLDIRKIGVVKNGEQVVGNRARVKVVKNKVAPPFREAEFDILYGVGVNVPGEIVDHATTAGLFEKSGSFYSFKGERIAQGRDKACAYVAAAPDEIAQECCASRCSERARRESRTRALRARPGAACRRSAQARVNDEANGWHGRRTGDNPCTPAALTMKECATLKRGGTRTVLKSSSRFATASVVGRRASVSTTMVKLPGRRNRIRSGWGRAGWGPTLDRVSARARAC
jgi:hypothetical protein